MRHAVFAALGLLALCSSASAQLVVGVDESLGESAWLVDVCTGQSEVLWNDYEAWGLAADDANGKLYIADGTTFGVWDYSQQGTLTAPTTIGLFTDSLGNSLSMVGLAFGNGTLYGYRTTSDQIWEIDTATGVSTVVYTASSTSANYGGFAYNPDDGLFYVTNDSSTFLSGYGVYSIDLLGAGTETFVAPYPTGETDIDGLGIGDGRLYLITDDLGDEIYTYDLAAAQYVKGVPNPTPATQIFSAGAWSPGLTLSSSPTVYCVAQVNSQGCTPAIASSGTPSTTSTAAFDISADMIVNNSIGILFYGHDRNESPFFGGTLCVLPPTLRTPSQSSGGTPPPAVDCSGVFSVDFNAVIQSGGDPNLVAGACVYVQFWSRDPLSAAGTNLTDALAFRIEP